MSATNQSMAEFLAWLRFYSPELWEKLNQQLRESGMQLSGELGFNWSGLLQQTVDLGAQVFQYQQQQDILEAQAKLAAQGMPLMQTGSASQFVVVDRQPTAQEIENQQLANTILRIAPWFLGVLAIIAITR